MNANTAVCCVRETHCKRKGIDRVNVNEWKTIYHAYANCAEAKLAKRASEQTDPQDWLRATNELDVLHVYAIFRPNRQTNKQDTHHCDLGRYRDADSKTFARPHLRMAHFAGQGPGLCYSPAELPVWH